jgi:hypothetical protein
MVKKKAKKKTRARVKLLTLDDVYRLINRAQVNKKEVNLPLSHEDAVIAENIIQDTGLKYNKKVFKTRITFVLHPPDDDIETDLEFDIDFFEDEINEDGQVF